jgi:predicted transcriptional regulator
MRSPKKLEPLSIRLDPDVRAGLEALATADDRSLSAYVHRVLRLHVERERAKAERKG